MYQGNYSYHHWREYQMEAGTVWVAKNVDIPSVLRDACVNTTRASFNYPTLPSPFSTLTISLANLSASETTWLPLKQRCIFNQGEQGRTLIPLNTQGYHGSHLKTQLYLWRKLKENSPALHPMKITKVLILLAIDRFFNHANARNA